MQNASISIRISEPKSGSELYQYDAMRNCIPASIVKLLTTSTTLAHFGPEFTFSTYLIHAKQAKKDHILLGDLYVLGNGDPSLCSKYHTQPITLDSLCTSMKLALDSAGIQQIDGGIIVDASYFKDSPVPDTWQYGDLGNSYASGVWGVNVCDNTCSYLFNRLADESSISFLGTIPEMPMLDFECKVQCAKGASKDDCLIYATPHRGTILLGGEIPAGPGPITIKGTLPFPPLALSNKLKSTLQSRNITVKLPATFSDVPSPARAINLQKDTIWSYQSPPLLDLMRITNSESQNMYAESFCKLLGTLKNSSGTTDAGIDTIMNYWRMKIPDINSIHLEDGSGLSARNLMNANFVTQLLNQIINNPELLKDFDKTLSISGTTGTLGNILVNSPAKGKILGKSGSMKRVKNYAGYVTTMSGNVYSFAILVNNFNCSSSQIVKKLEPILEQLIYIDLNP